MAGGRVAQHKAGTVGNPTSLQYLTYSYDANGNVLSILDGANSNQKQCFQYDTLNRLTQGSTYNDTSQGCTMLLGSGNYHEVYTYNTSTGNLASKTGIGTYTYNATHKHAVASTTNGWSFSYDANGNMVTRSVGTSYTYGYDNENRLVSVSGGTTASFVYDAEGVRVRGTVGGVTTTYVGNHFEWTGSTTTMKKYYYTSGTRVGMRVGTADPLWLLGDHLGSTSRVANFDGSPFPNGWQLYKPWGEKRYPSGTSGLPTTFRYTGQRQETSLGGADGLYYYGARWYDSYLNRWIQPDSIVPLATQGVQAWDRYAYVNNNPILYTDPSGHLCVAGQASPACNKFDIKNGSPSSSIPEVAKYIYSQMITNSQSETVSILYGMNQMATAQTNINIGLPEGSGFVIGSPLSYPATTGASAMGIWGAMVRPGGPWDHKPMIREMELNAGRDPDWQVMGSSKYFYDVWSNIHYGFVGMAAGFSVETLLGGAGAAQYLDNMINGKPNVATPGVEGWSKFDDPFDQAAILMGIYLWNTYGSDMTFEDMIYGISTWSGPEIHKEPVDKEHPN